MRIAGLLLAVIGGVGPQPVLAQTQGLTVREVSLEEALGLFNQNNIRLQLSRSDARVALGVGRQASAIPNPTGQVTREALSGNGVSYQETYFNLRQPVPLPWLVSARAASGRAMVAGATAEVAADSNQFQFEVKRSLVRTIAAERRLRVVRDVVMVFREVERAAAARFAEGDLSGYDLRRIRLELARYEGRFSEATVLRDDARRTLTATLLPGARDTVLTARDFLGDVPPSLAAIGWTARALAQRPEIAARRADITELEARARVVRSGRWLDEFTLTGGYKRQSDGLTGSFLGAEVSLPLWNRQGGTVVASLARVDAAQERARLAERMVLADVESTVRAYRSTADRVTRTEGRLYRDTGDLLDIARTSYDEGETDLLDLLDAADAYFTSRADLIAMRAELWERYFDLERAVGGFDAPSPAREGGP